TQATEVIRNNELFNIEISKVTVFPQTASIAYTKPQQFKNNTIGIVDWGGGTISGCVLQNLKLIHESKFTLNSGWFYLQEELIQELNKHFNMNIQPYEILSIVQSGLLKYKEESLK